MNAKHMYDAMNQFTAGNYQALQELAEINQRAFDRMVEKQMDLMNLWLDTGAKQLQLASEAKGVQDLVTGNLNLSKQVAAQMLGENKAALEIATQTRDELRVWMEKSASDVSEQLSQAAKKAQQAAA